MANYKALNQCNRNSEHSEHVGSRGPVLVVQPHDGLPQPQVGLGEESLCGDSTVVSLGN